MAILTSHVHYKTKIGGARKLDNYCFTSNVLMAGKLTNINICFMIISLLQLKIYINIYINISRIIFLIIQLVIRH